MKDLYAKLKAKGWAEEEIHRAFSILKYGKSNQKNHFNINHSSIYWTSLLLLIIINMVLCLMLVPFLISTKHSVLYILIIIFATGFGYVFNFILSDVEFTHSHHHIIAWIFIPAIALINIYIVVNLSNYFFILTGFREELYNPALTSLVYVISFMLPYIYSKVPDMIDTIFRKAYKTN